VIQHLDWLSAHKRMEKDVARMTVIKRDWCDLLSKYPEYAIALAVIHLIENDAGDWWKAYDLFKKLVESYEITDKEQNVPTNALQIALERLPKNKAIEWFSDCILEDKILWCANPAAPSYISMHYGHVFSDFFNDMQFARLVVKDC
jgi:hypothetical protein